RTCDSEITRHVKAPTPTTTRNRIMLRAVAGRPFPRSTSTTDAAVIASATIPNWLVAAALRMSGRYLKNDSAVEAPIIEASNHSEALRSMENALVSRFHNYTLLSLDVRLMPGKSHAPKERLHARVAKYFQNYSKNRPVFKDAKIYGRGFQDVAAESANLF